MHETIVTRMVYTKWPQLTSPFFFSFFCSFRFLVVANL